MNSAITDSLNKCQQIYGLPLSILHDNTKKRKKMNKTKLPSQQNPQTSCLNCYLDVGLFLTSSFDVVVTDHFPKEVKFILYKILGEALKGWDLCYPWGGYNFLEKIVISKMRQCCNLQGSAASNKSCQNWGEGTWPSFMGLEHCRSWGIRANYLLIHKVRKLTRTRCFWIKLFFLRKIYTDL